VATIYWTLYAIDRELIAPKANAIFVPWYVKHFLHTGVAVCIIIESFILNHQYKGWRKEASVLVTSMVAYIGWINIVYIVTGFWVYPVLKTIGSIGRIGFYIGNIATSIFFYFIGFFLNKRFWSQRIPSNSLDVVYSRKFEPNSGQA
jgi:hypothetical protein